MIKKRLVAKSILFHIIGIFIVVSLELYVSIKFAGQRPFHHYLYFYALSLSLFFLNGRVIIPHIYKGGAMAILAFTGLLFSILAHFLATLQIISFLNPEYKLSHGKARELFYVNAGYRALLVGLYSAAYALARYSISRERERRKLENGYLLALLNPHQIYNALYFVKAEMKDNPTNAQHMLDILSRSMQFSWENLSEDGKISLAQELEHVERHIAMHKLRYDGTFYLDIHKEIPAGYENSIYILPLLLTAFVDNMIKYGILTNIETPATLHVKYNEGFLEIHIHNKVSSKPAGITSGQGMRITERRLKNTYGRKYKLTIVNTKDDYTLDLKIRI